MSSVSVSKNDGVAPVIGTIMLVALTVVLIGITGAVLMDFASPEPAPILGISIVQQGNITTVTHLNGAVLPAGKFKILVDGVDKTAAFGGTGDFGPGMKLSWDSGAEAVGTVSVVYTSDKGVSTLIADKKIGKTGSGGGGGGGDIKILEIGGIKSNISSYWGDEWTNIVITAQNLTNDWDSVLIAEYKVYYDGGDYWWVRNPGLRITKAEADFDPSLNTFNAAHSNDLIKIKRDRLLTDSDTEYAWPGAVKFLGSVGSVNTGTLFKNGTTLYVWASDADSTFFGSSNFGPWTWAQIGIEV